MLGGELGRGGHEAGHERLLIVQVAMQVQYPGKARKVSACPRATQQL